MKLLENLIRLNYLPGLYICLKELNIQIQKNQNKKENLIAKQI